MKVPFLDLRESYEKHREELEQAMLEAMRSGWYVLGKQVEAFEQEFAEYCGAKHCIGVGNGLEALCLMLQARGIGPGDEVIVPSNGYIATWLAVSRCGAKPVPVEPTWGTYNLDPSRVSAAITPKTRAILPIHLYGQTADMAPLREIAERHGIDLMDDCAQAHGARYVGARTGSLALASGFSFYPTKNLGALGDGGAVCTDDDALADTVRLLRNYGSRVKYHNELKGENSRLDELQAAVLRVKLRKLEQENSRRTEIASRYSQALGFLPELILPEVTKACDPVWHVFIVRHPDRDALQKHLAEREIGTLIYYPTPPHLSPAYSDAGYQAGDFPIAEEQARTNLSLPIGPTLSDEQVEWVIESVQTFCTSGVGAR